MSDQNETSTGTEAEVIEKTPGSETIEGAPDETGEGVSTPGGESDGQQETPEAE